MSHRISRAPCGPWPATDTARDMMVITTGTSSASNQGVVAGAANLLFFILFMSFCLSFPCGHNLESSLLFTAKVGCTFPSPLGTCNPAQPGSCEPFVQPGDCVQTEDTSLFTQGQQCRASPRPRRTRSRSVSRLASGQLSSNYRPTHESLPVPRPAPSSVRTPTTLRWFAGG